MSLWKQLRIPLLVFTFANVVLVLAGQLIQALASGRLPCVSASDTLPQWQLVESKPLKAETVELLAFGKVILPGGSIIYPKGTTPRY